MTSAITAYERPRRFVDQQQSGPFRSWRHEHTFDPLPSGATLMTDRVDFSSPVGRLGSAVDRAVLIRYMSRLLGDRGR